MSLPVFVLGVGAQKSGTSFLYRALAAHPDVRLSQPKEMHVFDAYFLPQMCGQFHRRRRDAVIERLGEEPEDPSRSARAKTAQMLRHLRMNYDLSEYVAYFRELAEGGYLTGDITPSYQMMEAEHFGEIRALLAPEFDVRVVFLMRDPIDRIFSAMRMDDRNGKRETNLAHERFGRTFGDEKHRRRTDYQSTAESLDSVFPAGSVFYELYENLFRPETFERLGKFLGPSGLAPDFDTRVNASPTLGRLSPDAIAAARDFYAPTYDFCKKRFGEETVTRLWANA